MMTFPIYGKIKHGNQTTNQMMMIYTPMMIPIHTSVNVETCGFPQPFGDHFLHGWKPMASAQKRPYLDGPWDCSTGWYLASKLTKQWIIVG